MDHNEPCIALSGVGDGGGDAAFRGSAVLLPADGVRLLLRPLLLRQERTLLLAPGDKDITARRSILAASTREPRKSRVVFSVRSRARYTRNPSLDIYLLSVWTVDCVSMGSNPAVVGYCGSKKRSKSKDEWGNLSPHPNKLLM